MAEKIAKAKLIGDLPYEEWLALWDNDPYSIKMTPELAARRERDGFYLNQDRGNAPEDCYSPGPERERYREFLKTHPKEE